MDSSNYTRIAFIISFLFVCIVTTLFTEKINDTILLRFMQVQWNCRYLDTSCTVLIFGSFIAPDDLPFSVSAPFYLWLLAFGVMGFLVMIASLYLDQDPILNGRTFLCALAYVVGFVPVVALMDWASAEPSTPLWTLPFFLLWLVYLFTAYAVFMTFGVTGLLCLVRVAILATTQTAMSTQWSKQAMGADLKGEDVADALGKKSTSETHARAMNLDIKQSLREAEEHLDDLKEEADAMSAAIKTDNERMINEAKLAALMEEIELMKVENEALRRDLDARDKKD